MKNSQVWWYTPILPAPVRLKQEDYKFKASLGYKARPCFKNKTKQGWGCDLSSVVLS
jgi:hypothetical protein